jgi:hypothetical protein
VFNWPTLDPSSRLVRPQLFYSPYVIAIKQLNRCFKRVASKSVWLCLEVSLLTTGARNNTRAAEVADDYPVNRIIQKHNKILLGLEGACPKGRQGDSRLKRNHNFTNYNFAKSVLT